MCHPHRFLSVITPGFPYGQAWLQSDHQKQILMAGVKGNSVCDELGLRTCNWLQHGSVKNSGFYTVQNVQGNKGKSSKYKENQYYSCWTCTTIRKQTQSSKRPCIHTQERSIFFRPELCHEGEHTTKWIFPTSPLSFFSFLSLSLARQDNITCGKISHSKKPKPADPITGSSI